MSLNRDEFGFDAPVELGHPIRSRLPEGHSTGPEIGERLPDEVEPAPKVVVQRHDLVIERVHCAPTRALALNTWGVQMGRCV